ncbi:MAG: TIGR02300 family protein [Alphaproteobacteria bacterium]
MIKLEWGTKRLCQSCTARFYDMCRTPIVCPKCGETFELQTPSRSRKSRAAAAEEKLTATPLDILDVDIALPEDIDPELVADDDLLADAEDIEDMDDIPSLNDASDEH